MWEIWTNWLLPKGLKTCPKSNKSPNLVTLSPIKSMLSYRLHEIGFLLQPFAEDDDIFRFKNLFHCGLRFFLSSAAAESQNTNSIRQTLKLDLTLNWNSFASNWIKLRWWGCCSDIYQKSAFNWPLPASFSLPSSLAEFTKNVARKMYNYTTTKLY